MNYPETGQTEQMKQVEEIKKKVLRKILTRDAIERLGRIRLVKPELASQLELYLVQLYQTGQIKEALNDVQIKDILRSIGSQKEFKIRR